MARRRFPFILQIYVILRDARHKGWTSPPPILVKARTTYTSKVLLSIQTRLPVGTSTCSYCLSRTLHAGSHASCPFKSKTKTVARAAAAAATSKLEAGMSKAAAIAEALAEAE